MITHRNICILGEILKHYTNTTLEKVKKEAQAFENAKKIGFFENVVYG